MTDSGTPAELNRDTFLPHVGSSFRVSTGNDTVELTLVNVSELRTSPRSEAFSIEFHGPSSSSLAQAEYQFDHPVVGEFTLFIVPVGRDGDVLEYEAVFNRVLPRS